MRRRASWDEIWRMWETVLDNTWYEKSEGDNTMADLTELEIDGVYTRNNTITIATKQLPSVYDNGTRMEASLGSPRLHEYSVSVMDTGKTHEWHLRMALCHLAMREYKLTTEHQKTVKRDKRRNELADIFAPGSGWNRLSIATQRAIDYIIADEDKTHG